ncbi:MAG: hypothetical protein KC635_01065, partial [Myxococcales bacterium]|nr:hypothetical protein [Myxococcales bacterium]
FSAGLAGWTQGANHPTGPTRVTTGGPLGAGDAYLRVSADGSSGPGGRLTVFHETAPWIGDWSTSGVAEIAVDLKNEGATALTIRLELESGAVRMQTESRDVPVGGGWATYRFLVVAPRLLGTGDGAAVLANVTKLRIQHNPSGTNQQPPTVVAQLGVDNVRAVADTCGNGWAGAGEACDGADLKGATCVTQGLSPGDLACATDCLDLDDSGCAVCDDGTCSDGEDANNCPEDCEVCGDGIMSGLEACDGSDFGGATCATEGAFDGGALTCLDLCGTVSTEACTTCGDGTCEAGETLGSCPADCAECGDGICTSPVETVGSCAMDCAIYCGDGVANGGEGCDWGTVGAISDLFVRSDELLGLSGVAESADGFLYLADPARGGVHRADADSGAWLDFFVDTIGNGVVDVAIGPDGALYVVTRDSNKVEIYDRALGTFAGSLPLGGGVTRPEAIAFRASPARVYIVTDRS